MGFIEAMVFMLFGIFAYMKINKRGKIADWSWWRVTSPLWIYAISAIVIVAIFFGIFGAMVSVPMIGF